MEPGNTYMKELLTNSYDATIKENQIQISADQLESYVRDMAQLLASNQQKEDSSQSETYEDTYRSTFPPLYENENFHELVEKTSRFLERSVVVIDLGFHVIDYSREIKVTDPLWSEYVKRGSCTYEFIKAMNEMLPAEKLPKTSEAFFVTCPLSDEIKLCSLLFYKKHHIGYLILLDNKKGIQPYHQQFLPRISKKLAKSLRYHEEYGDLFISASTEILTNLLNGNPIEEGEATLLSKTLQLPGAIKLYLFRGRFSTLHDVSFLRNQLNEFRQLLHVFVYHNYVVAFVKVEEESSLREELTISRLFDQIDDATCSNVFHYIDEIPGQYRIARTTFSIASKLGRKQKFYPWKEFEFFHILNDCKDREQLRSYVHPAIYILMEYDQGKDGQLLDTLKAYITCGLSSKDTAAALFVHRNTLTYRLKKITELTGIRLEDISEILRLDRSMKILEFLG
ncbi:MAG: helix-turn-helix domain-containing protein [Lachnospiraceae bacterium]|nr:helix-turn-helix domain-containing protein [Lachnospiraceae bacterium]